MKNKYKYLIVLLILEVLLNALIFARFGEVAYNGDALYEAQVARNVLAGKGYVTSEMPLYAVNLYKEIGLSTEAPWLNTHKFALPVYIKAVFIKIFGDNLTSITFLYSYFFHFLTLILIYFLAFKIWPDKPGLAFLTAFIFIINPVLGFGTPYIMVSGLNLVVDAFIFLLFLYVILLWKERRSQWILFLSGFISGVAFLDRYNSGLYIVAAFIILFYFFVLKLYKERPLKDLLIQFIKKYLIYFSGFAIIFISFFVWNLKVIGHPFLSINGLFQLLFDTQYNSFIDPWYKLEYIFPTSNPFSFALMHPIALIVKWLKYASLDIIRFISFEGVLWWTPLVLGYFLISRKDSGDDSVKNINFLLSFTIILTILQIMILPLWAGAIAYFFYLFPVFSFAIAYFLYFIYKNLFIEMSLLKNGSISDIFKKIGNMAIGKSTLNGLLFFLVMISLFFLITDTSFGLFKILSIKSYFVIVFALFLSLGIIFISLKYSKLLLTVFISLGLLYFIAQTGIIIAPSNAEILRLRWDLEDNTDNIKLLEKIDSNGIVVSATPWNIAWWSNNNLESLPIPEYPDEIYSLETKYNQKIDTIYLNKIIKYSFKYISYSWTAYQRAIKFGYTFDGFEVFRRLPDGIILKRIEKFSFPPMTNLIDFGKESANSHLIWGWGENLKEDEKRDYVIAGKYNYLTQNKEIFQGTRIDEKKIAKDDTKEILDILIENDGRRIYYKPDAEVSFLADGEWKPNKAEIVLKSPINNQNIKVILNGNLLYVGQPGIDLGDFSVNNNWQKIIININSKDLNDGINKLSFIFSGTYFDFFSEDKFAFFDYLKFYRE